MSIEQIKPYIDQLNRDKNKSHAYRAISAYQMINHIDQMIETYLRQPQNDPGAILLDVFGLLQGLFVAIDGLYDLAIGLTRYKYHININANPILHELKYVRNDIVGHPTHRTYYNGGTGFSLIKHDQISKEKMTYQTFIYQKNHIEVREKQIIFKDLIKQYKLEKNHILNDIYKYLIHQNTKTDIPEQIFTLYETMQLTQLENIKTSFINAYQLDKTSNHRFFWRASLVKTLICWHEQEDMLNELILYMTKVQISKMYEIALDMEKRRGHRLYTDLPSLLVKFYKFMRKHEKEAYELLTNLHDLNHPLHDGDLMALMMLNPPKEVYRLLMFLKQLKDSEKVYLIGSELRKYRRKNHN